MRDRPSERAVGLRPLNVDVDPLVIAGYLGELVDELLGHLAPVAGADRLAYELSQLVDSVNGGGHEAAAYSRYQGFERSAEASARRPSFITGWP